MSNKITVSFSIPVRVKLMMEKGAVRTFSTNTKYIVDLIRKDYGFWFENKDLPSIKEKLKEENNNE